MFGWKKISERELVDVLKPLKNVVLKEGSEITLKVNRGSDMNITSILAIPKKYYGSDFNIEPQNPTIAMKESKNNVIIRVILPYIKSFHVKARTATKVTYSAPYKRSQDLPSETKQIQYKLKREIMGEKI